MLLDTRKSRGHEAKREKLKSFPVYDVEGVSIANKLQVVLHFVLLSRYSSATESTGEPFSPATSSKR